ncbi:MAG: DUF368 domain-containing protein [Candidatus Diapherotrites archaeon]
MAFREFFSIFLKGILMGAANILPGISGGTIAFITGIYERLIYAINSLDFSFALLFLQGKKKEAVKALSRIDFGLFVPLLLGISVSFLLLSRFVKAMLTEQTAIAYAFFLGLIAGSLILILGHAAKSKFSKKVFIESTFVFFISFLFAFYFFSIPQLMLEHSPWLLFLSGIAAACAMLLPGISGAYIVLVLGQYDYLLDALQNLSFFPLFIFSLGMLLGFLGFSKVLAKLMEKYKTLVFALLSGLVFGSLRMPAEKIIAAQPVNYLAVILSALAGFGIVILIEKKASSVRAKSKSAF